MIINNSNSSSTTNSSCVSYLWIGTNYTQSGTYDSTFTNISGCDSTATLILTITVNPVAAITQIGNDLQVNQATTYIWSTNESTQIITPTSNGTYWCVITDGLGCISDTAFYNVNFIPTTILEQNENKKLISITDVLGRKTKKTNNTTLFYIYDDGTVEKRFNVAIE